MRNTTLMNPSNAFERGYVLGVETFEKAVEEFMVLVSAGLMPSEVDACDFFATKLHEVQLGWNLTGR